MHLLYSFPVNFYNNGGYDNGTTKKKGTQFDSEGKATTRSRLVCYMNRPKYWSLIGIDNYSRMGELSAIVTHTRVVCGLLSVWLSNPKKKKNYHIQEPIETSEHPIRTRYLGHVTGYHPIRGQYFLIRSVPVISYILKADDTYCGYESTPNTPSTQNVTCTLCRSIIIQEPTGTSKKPIRTRYLGNVTGYHTFRDQYFLIRSVPVISHIY
eukprot:sb/3470252/